MIDADTLKEIGVSDDLADKWGVRFTFDLVEFGITGVERESAFLGQVLHESGYLQHTKENLNYSASALMSVFGKYFPTQTLADSYARQPERIANRVYASRMGNGDEASGDGWKHRGDGFIQLTGHDNQSAYRLWAGDKGPIDPLLSAIWFWLDNDLNVYADKGDIKGLSKRVNGGYNGLEDRIAITDKAGLVLA